MTWDWEESRRDPFLIYRPLGSLGFKHRLYVYESQNEWNSLTLESLYYLYVPFTPILIIIIIIFSGFSNLAVQESQYVRISLTVQLLYLMRFVPLKTCNNNNNKQSGRFWDDIFMVPEMNFCLKTELFDNRSFTAL